MYELINESINVKVDFTKKQVTPLSFSWRNKDYKISTIELTYTSKKGASELFHFSVTSKDNVYKITFNPKTLSWQLDEIFLNPTKLKHTLSVNEPSYSTYRLR